MSLGSQSQTASSPTQDLTTPRSLAGDELLQTDSATGMGWAQERGCARSRAGKPQLSFVSCNLQGKNQNQIKTNKQKTTL